MFNRSIAFLAVLLLCATAGAPMIRASAPSDEAAITHGLNRLTYGPRPGDVERVRTIGIQRWIELQLSPGRIDNAALETRLRSLKTLTLDSQTIQREYSDPAMRRRPASDSSKKYC